MDPGDGPRVRGAGGSVCWLSRTPPTFAWVVLQPWGHLCPSVHPPVLSSIHPSIHPPTHPIPLSASQPRVELQPSAPGCWLCTPRDLMPPSQPVPRARGCSQTCTFIYKKPSARAGPCKPCTEPKATSTCCHQRGWGAAFRPHPYPGPSTEGSAAATEGTDTPAACTALAPRHKKKAGGRARCQPARGKAGGCKAGGCRAARRGAQGRRGGLGWARSGRSTRCPGTRRPRHGPAGGRQFLCVGGQR